MSWPETSTCVKLIWAFEGPCSDYYKVSLKGGVNPQGDGPPVSPVQEKHLALPKEERQSQVSFSALALVNERQFLIPTHRGQ